MENLFSRSVSLVAQSWLIFSSITSSSSVILGLNSGMCAMHSATQRRTTAGLISTAALCRKDASEALVQDGGEIVGRVHTAIVYPLHIFGSLFHQQGAVCPQWHPIEKD